MLVTNKRIGIAGAGLLGRLLAWRLARQGCKVRVFDKGDACSSAAYAAGGMLAPQAEQEIAPPYIYDLGMQSMQLWPQWLNDLDASVHWQQSGSIFVSHQNDMLECERIVKRMHGDVIRLDQQQLRQLEPELKFTQGYWLKQEGYIDARGLLKALIKQSSQYDIHYDWGVEVISTGSGSITTHDKTWQFDHVFDCRGCGATDQFEQLRPVRGELIYIHAPAVTLNRPIRLMHPRYRVYIVPRANNIYLIGASEIEADDMTPISVRSCLELLSAAYAVHSGFAEGRIIETISAKRPALADNLPCIKHQSKHTAINGLYRHGFLLAPALVQEALL